MTKKITRGASLHFLGMVSGVIEPPEVPALIVSHDKRGSTLGDAISENHDGSR
jgi:hypothetical protein